jgi:hypothetical protein
MSTIAQDAPAGPPAAASPAAFRPPNVALTTLGLALATFMQVLDTTIANVSLPTIAGNLGVSTDQSDLGDHRVRRQQRHRAAADRLADAALRRVRCSSWRRWRS